MTAAPVLKAAVQLAVMRSAFRFFCYRVATAAAAQAAVAALRQDNPQATHVLYAYRIRPVGDGLVEEGVSENGEPVRAAHRTLALLRSRGLVGYALVCVRYYGGRKLGAANLGHVLAHGFGLVLDQALKEDGND